MKALYSTGYAEKISLDLENKSIEELVEICEKYMICAFLDVYNEKYKISNQKIFIKVNNSLLYLPAFYIQQSNNKKYYILKSIIDIQNSIVLENKQYHFSESGKLKIPISEGSYAIYLYGIFGFRIDKNRVNLFDKAYIHIISCFDESVYHIRLDNNQKCVTVKINLSHTVKKVVE